MRVHNIQVVQIATRLDEVQDSLRSGEAVARVIRRPAVDVVDGPVPRVPGPQRVPFPAGHGVRAQQHVGRVPEDERDGEEQPERDGGCGRVYPFLGRGAVVFR